MPADTTAKLDFEQLGPYQERRFVPPQADLTVLDQVKPLCQKLLERSIHSSLEMEEWLRDRSELEAALSQAGTILYIRMTCQTDDPSRARAYQQFIETIQPVVKVFTDQLNRKFLAEQAHWHLNEQLYHVYARGLRTDVDLFVQENVMLQTEVDLLTQEYQTITGAMTVEFEGKERTMPEMGKVLYEPDRGLRERAWKAAAGRRLRDKDQLEKLFDRLVSLRVTIAKNAGCANFCEYKFRSLHRFDYTSQSCKQYHQSIEKLVVPLWQRVLERRKKEMQLQALRPWDTAVDPLGRPPLRPFNRANELMEGCQRIFERLDPGLGKNFSEMLKTGSLDLESRKGKAPGGYQSTLDEARKPFIFMNAVGLDDDVRTLLHEAGHAFHALACAGDPLLNYRHGPMEFNEVASMGMELLADPYLSVFYGPEDEQRSRREHWEGIAFILVWVAIIDAFQHWLYEHPGHTPDERREAWLRTHRRFGGDGVDWKSLEEEHAFLWHRQLHIFEVPFYYIEYGIAQLGALQLWHSARKDPKTALENYKMALALGGSKPLPELFKTAGIRFDFSAETIAPLTQAIAGQLQL
ncbi:MAG: M3 family oligoendopeptidase [Candidatus Omnitrophica bacterium]|nr:M3 family oligoendopeptidase [Candidatus Omnitrophota bacterium]